MRKVAPILLLALALCGCPSGTYHDAVVAEHQFKTGVAAFQKAEMVEFQNGRIDQVEHQKIEAGIEKIGLAAQTLVKSLQGGSANTTVQQNFGTVEAAITDLLNNGVLAIKNEQSKQLLRVAIQTASDILVNVGQLLAAPTTVPTKAASLRTPDCGVALVLPCPSGCELGDVPIKVLKITADDVTSTDARAVACVPTNGGQ
jgi:hypothetical protein